MAKFNILLLVGVGLFKFAQAAPSANCLLCNKPMSAESLKIGQDDPCEDLYAAACLTPQGTLRFAGTNEARDTILRGRVLAAFDVGAQELGFANTTEALKAKLKARGIEMNADPDPKELEKLLQAPGTYFGSSSSEALFGSNAKCTQEAVALAPPTKDGPLIMSVTEAKAYAEKYITLAEKYRALTVKHNATDIEAYVMELMEKCEQYKNNASDYPEKLNPTAARVCSQTTTFRRRAVEIYRRESTPGYQAEAEKLVSEFSIGELRRDLGPSMGMGMGTGMSYVSSSGNYASPKSAGAHPANGIGADKVPDQPEVPTPEETAAMTEMLVAAGEASMACKPYSDSVVIAAESTAIELVENLAKSKKTVEHLIGSTYSADRRTKAEEAFASARIDVEDIVSRIVTDPKKRGAILDSYPKIEMFWMDKPPASYYSNSNGTSLLDTQKIPVNDNALDYFQDPSLSFFSQLNASYMPSLTVGSTHRRSNINMNPAMLELLDKNPSAYLGTLSHEFGHNIDFNVSQVNGFDLRAEYREVLACYKEPTSINLAEGQEGETIGDYIASEVLARQINRLPQDQRRRAVLSAMEGKCAADELNENGSRVDCTEEHPEPSLRVSGIFGASPNLRAAMGCEKDSSKYKTCGMSALKGTSTPLPNTQAPINSVRPSEAK